MQLTEPIGVIYKWYAWYMLGYCCNKKDYRLFKVVRMGNFKKLEEKFSIKHEDMDKLLVQQEKRDNRKYLDVKILCKEAILISAQEYFSNGNSTVLENGDFILQFTVPENEIGWKGILLTYGNKVKIIEPEELKVEFCQRQKKLLMFINNIRHTV